MCKIINVNIIKKCYQLDRIKDNISKVNLNKNPTLGASLTRSH